jgi:hypothetical protein
MTGRGNVLRVFQDLIDESIILAAMSRQAFSADPSKLQSIAYMPDSWTCKEEIMAALPSLFVQDREVKIGTKPIVALGLTLDSGLTFEKHINAKIGMAHRRLDVMERLNSEPWHTDAHTMVKRVYAPWVASLWEYASQCWGTASPRLLGKIDAVERRALAICLKVPATTTTARLVLLREAKCVSAQKRRMITAAMHWHKVIGSRADSQAGRMLKEWKENSPDWRAEVQEAKTLCAWIDQQTEKVLSGMGKPRGAIKNGERERPFVTPLAFCAAAAETLQMTTEQVGMVEPFGLEDASQRQCPFLDDPCGGYASPLPLLTLPINAKSLKQYDWDQLFPRGGENRDYDKVVMGSASERSDEQKAIANEYASALATCASQRASKHSSNVVCATDGACQTSYGPSVLEKHRLGIDNLWTRQGSGAGAVISGAQDNLLAEFGTRHGQVSDSAADEMAGLHAILMALVGAYLGEEEATSIDSRGMSARALGSGVWQTEDSKPPQCLKIARGETTIIISCDNQDVARAARTESLTTAPHRGGTARANGYATHNEIVAAKRALTRAGASVQIVWVPGHTNSCWQNIRADELADQAAVSSHLELQGNNALCCTRQMLRNHMSRRADQLLNNSWYHWYKDQMVSPWGRRTVSGQTYLQNCVLWEGPTVNWMDDEAVRHQNATRKPRWLTMPVEIGFASTSFQAAKSITRLRLNLPTRNVANGRAAKVSEPECPWCGLHKDSGRHRFECQELQMHRQALVGRLREATSPQITTGEAENPRREGEDWRSDQEVLEANFTWDVLIKGQYSKGEFYNLERYTAPPKEAREELADIVHTFLKKSLFYNRVFDRGAECTDEVTAAYKAKVARDRAEAAGEDGSSAAGKAPGPGPG